MQDLSYNLHMTSTKTDGSTTPTYKPRMWVGSPIATEHWWWNDSAHTWKFFQTERYGRLHSGDVFFPPGPIPSEAPGDDLEECAKVDWLPQSSEDIGELRRRAEVAEARVVELEAMLASQGDDQ